MTSMHPQEYRDLLQVALANPTDADTIEPHPHSLFTPRGHRYALDPDATIVKGGRGVGKTVWFRALQSSELRKIAAEEYRLPSLLRVRPHPGFGSNRNPDLYPPQKGLQSLVKEGKDPRDIWTAVILTGLGVKALEGLSWSERVDWVDTNWEETDRALQAADQNAADNIELFLFDAIDRLHYDRSVNDQLATGILQLALDLRMNTKNIRAKIFIRHDMLGSLSLNFADASKLISNVTELVWTRTNLYGLFFHHLGNADHPHSEKFRSETGTWTRTAHRFAPPDSLLNDPEHQKDKFVAIAGAYMGRNHRKGHTYTWLPNHLADGADQVSPRSFLKALHTASQRSANQYGNYDHALHWDAIKHGVRDASEIRKVEISEDIRWVNPTIEPLAGKQVPIEPDEVVSCWNKANIQQTLTALMHGSADGKEAATGPRDTSPNALIKELIEIGVLTRRNTGKLDMPDIYRVAFGLGRKGGVPRVRTN